MCRNPSFGLATKAKRGCRVAGQEEAQESHHIFPGVQGVQGSVRECEGVNNHTPGRGSPSGLPNPSALSSPKWTPESQRTPEPKWTPETLESNLRGQNSMDYDVLYIIGKLLERRCLK
jgi:hypothetical protein